MLPASGILLERKLSDIVINYDGTIIKGHQRCTVMMDLGIEEAEVVVLNIRDKGKEKQANVALNKITGRWDERESWTLRKGSGTQRAKDEG